MSTGIVICSTCNREVHQDGDKSIMNGWRHCDDKSPICSHAIYPESLDQIKGKWCGCDDDGMNRSLTNYAELDIARTAIYRQVKLGRNDPCPCGSGNKYKNCCLGKVGQS